MRGWEKDIRERKRSRRSRKSERDNRQEKEVEKGAVYVKLRPYAIATRGFGAHLHCVDPKERGRRRGLRMEKRRK